MEIYARVVRRGLISSRRWDLLWLQVARTQVSTTAGQANCSCETFLSKYVEYFLTNALGLTCLF